MATTTPSKLPPEPDLNAIGVLRRREIEARLLVPLIDALGRAFGSAAVLEVVGKTIVEIARQQGRELAERAGASSLTCFADSLGAWTADRALELEVLERSDEQLSFDVTRCRYAELYRALGVPELGALFSCNRDASLIEGFNPRVRFTRTQTIMEGAPCCDFRYQLESEGERSS